jgi:transposase-like protein
MPNMSAKAKRAAMRAMDTVKKPVTWELGQMEMAVPRDRQAEFEPQLV